MSTMRMSQPLLMASRRASLARRSTVAVFGLADLAFVDMRADGLGDDLQLLARGGTVDVDRDEHGAVSALFEPSGEFAGGGGFTGTLQAGHEDDGGRLRCELDLGRVACRGWR